MNYGLTSFSKDSTTLRVYLFEQSLNYCIKIVAIEMHSYLFNWFSK
jgi:hypothetical protein